MKHDGGENRRRKSEAPFDFLTRSTENNTVKQAFSPSKHCVIASPTIKSNFHFWIHHSFPNLRQKQGIGHTRSNHGPTMADTGTPKDTTAASDGSKAAPTASNSSSSRKRKADELSEETPPHLPAPVWGHVLDFMPYAEVRSALLVGKCIAVEAVRHVQTLNMMRGCELHIPAARRFANVEEVKILCLLELTGEVDSYARDLFSVSLDVSNRTMPFFGSFAKLTCGFVGGLDRNGCRQRYNRAFVRGHHSDFVLKHLLTAYVGAIKSGFLSREIAMEGMMKSSAAWREHSLCREKSSNCEWCRDILSHYPLNDLLRYLVDNEAFFCQTAQEAWGIVRRRPDADKGFSEVSEEVLCEEVDRSLWPRSVRKEFRAAAVVDLPEKWRLVERKCEYLRVCSISQRKFRRIDDLIEKGFNPKYVTRKFAWEKWKVSIGASYFFNFFTWTRTTVEKLAARGFPVDCNSIPVIDDKYIDEKYSSKW